MKKMTALTYRFSPRTRALLVSLHKLNPISCDLCGPQVTPYQLTLESATSMASKSEYFATEEDLRLALEDKIKKLGGTLPAAGGRPTKGPAERLVGVSVRVGLGQAYAIEKFGAAWLRQVIEEGIEKRILADMKAKVEGN